MKSCLLCPRGTACRGYVLHQLIVKLYDALEHGDNADEVARELSAADMKLLAEYGMKARSTCWSKGFVLAVAAKLTQMVGAGASDAALRNGIDRLIVRMDGLFAKLPNGIEVDLVDLTLDIYNQAVANLKQQGADGFLPMAALGSALSSAQQRKDQGKA